MIEKQFIKNSGIKNMTIEELYIQRDRMLYISKQHNKNIPFLDFINDEIDNRIIEIREKKLNELLK